MGGSSPRLGEREMAKGGSTTSGPAQREPTINDVAALSGVSKSTVSNVVRGTGSVSGTTRQRVVDAIDSLGYLPNAAARNLVQRRTSLIGVVVGNIANAFNAELVKHIEREASIRDYTTVICNTSWRPEHEAARIEALLEQRVDGILMLEFSGDRAVLSKLLSERVPVVMVSCWADYADSVAIDDYAAIALAVDHLVELGHRRIGYANDAVVELATRRARHEAFVHALHRHGLAPREEWTVTGDDEGDSLRRWAAQQLTAPARPSAIVSVNDHTALRVIEHLEGAGLRVPRDVSIVGLDGIAIGALARLALTTVAQPREELAQRGVRLLLDRIAHGYHARTRRQRLAPQLIVRGTTAPPAGTQA